MADFTEVVINNDVRDVNVKDGKLTEQKLDDAARAKLFPHTWMSEEEFEDLDTPVDGMTYFVYEDEDGGGQ